MKKLYIIILIHLFFYSCIDIIIDEEFYESVYLNKSGWFEFYKDNQNEKLQFETNLNSSIQIWFSGQEQPWEIAPCILNIEGEEFEEHKGDSDTVAGFILEQKGDFPFKGENISFKNYLFTIEAMDKKRIKRVKLKIDK